MNDAQIPDALEPAEPVGAVGDAGARGSLVLQDRAVERIVEAAVLEVDGVLRHSDTLEKVTGRSLPRIDVVVAGSRVRASVEIATRWPTSLADVASRTRDGVTRALGDFAGLTVDAVDVHVAHLPTDIPERTRVQ